MNAIMMQEDFRQHLAREMGQFKSVLPGHIKPEHFLRVAMIAVTEKPELLEADIDSLISALLRAAKDGLIPDSKECAITVFNTNIGNKQNPKYIKKAQYLPMVDGVLKRARQSGQIKTINAQVVYEHDTLRYWEDENGAHFHYESDPSKPRENPAFAAAWARMTNGELMVEFMTLGDLEKVRKSSKNPDHGPWKEWWDRMARKSVLHRISKGLPNNSEIMELLDAGNFLYEKREEKDITPPSANETAKRLSDLAGPPIMEISQFTHAELAEMIKEATNESETNEIANYIDTLDNEAWQKELTQLLNLRRTKIGIK